MSAEGEVTALLEAVRRGESMAWDQLFARIYDDLHNLAQHRRHGEAQNHTLQTTALVHEAFLRLVRERDRSWQNRAHFLAIASTAMRRILVDHAKNRRAAKRGGGQAASALDDAVLVFEQPVTDLLALNEALEELAASDERKSRIVELRFFSGLTLEEIAQVLSVTRRTVDRDWRYARAWIRERMERGPGETS